MDSSAKAVLGVLVPRLTIIFLPPPHWEYGRGRGESDVNNTRSGDHSGGSGMPAWT